MVAEAVKQPDVIRFIRRVTRTLSLISMGVLLLFFIGEGFNPLTITLREWALFVFFPLGTVTGMLIAWRREIPGGLITTLSLLGFYLMHGLVSGGVFPRGWAFMVFSLPGLLFLLCGLIDRDLRH